jgi:hypothetical protein
MIIKDANHVDLYDRLDRIPFDQISEFFGKNLTQEASTGGVGTEASLAR